MAEISDKKYEELRIILEKQNGRAYTFEEVKEIGDGLIDFYKLLRKLDNETGGLENEQTRAIDSGVD